MRKATIAISIAGACLATSDARGNAFRQLPFDERVRRADLVVVGQVLSIRHGPETERDCAVVRVRSTLKGAAQDEICVVHKTGISESEPDCCETGASYLFLLEKKRAGLLVPVNGKHGVSRLP